MFENHLLILLYGLLLEFMFVPPYLFGAHFPVSHRKQCLFQNRSSLFPSLSLLYLSSLSLISLSPFMLEIKHKPSFMQAKSSTAELSHSSAP